MPNRMRRSRSMLRTVSTSLILWLAGCAAPRIPSLAETSALYNALTVAAPARAPLPTATGAASVGPSTPLPEEPASPQPDLPLTLDEVLESVRLRYPPLLAALIERDIAAGKLLTAEGAFDLNLAVKSTWYALGFYRRNETDANFEQPTALWGTTLMGGYRLGRGSFPDYYGNRQTLDGGEFRLGARVPLLRDGPIDARRAALRQAQIDVDLADPFIARARLDFLRAAALAYWDWVRSGRRLRIAEGLLSLATARNAQVSRRVEQGDLPAVEAVDNERLVVSRQVAVTAADRSLQKAAISLSLFLRDDADRPVIVSANRLPPELPATPAPQPGLLEGDIDAALAARPEVRRIRLLIERADVDKRFVENRMLPSLDVVVAGSQDLAAGGKTKDKGPFELEAGVEFKMPLQRRDARGKVRTAEATLSRLRTDEVFAQNRIVAEVRDAASALAAASEQIGQAEKGAELARRLAELERRSFELGKSNLLFVNLREQQSAEAEAARLDAVIEYLRANVEYRISRGGL